MKTKIGKRSLPITLLLLIITCGIYELYLFYMWAQEINKLGLMKKHKPGLFVLFDAISLGFVSVFIQAIIAYDIEQIHKDRIAEPVEPKKEEEEDEPSYGDLIVFISLVAFFLSFITPLLRGPIVVAVFIVGLIAELAIKLIVQWRLNCLIDDLRRIKATDVC